MVQFPKIEDEEEFKDFDPFFVGKGSAALIGKGKEEKKNLMWQFSGVKDVKSLKSGEQKSAIIEPVNDIEEFVKEKNIILPSNYEERFFKVKKGTYRTFDYLKIKAENIDTPTREKDLILTEEDMYLLDFLKKNVKDYFAITSIADLTALKEMGIEEVVFQQWDNCPMCKCFNGTTFVVNEVLEKLCSGEYVVHPYCDCRFFPKIYREVYEGPLKGHLDIDREINGRIIKNIPIEFDPEVVAMQEFCLDKKIEFVNMLDKYESADLEDSEGVVAVLRGDTIYIHNSWVGNYDPIDFLEMLLDEGGADKVKETVNLDDAEEFVLKGKRILRKNGCFWDPETKERVDTMSFKKTGDAKKSGEVQEVKGKETKKEEVRDVSSDQKKKK